LFQYIQLTHVFTLEIKDLTTETQRAQRKIYLFTRRRRINKKKTL